MIVIEFFTAETRRREVRKGFLMRAPRTQRLRVFAVKYLLLSLTLVSSHTNAQSDFATRLSRSAIELTKQQVFYDGTYFRISYPNGDVPSDRGVCTDVVIRAYRKL